MKKAILVVFICSLLVFLGFSLGSLVKWPVPMPTTISGTILTAAGPVAGALVQIKGTDNKTTAAQDGTFQLSGVGKVTPVMVTAWTPGYFIGWVELNPQAQDWQDGKGIQITLKPLYENDNAKYPWFSFEGVSFSASCGLCHREYPEWQADAHSQSAVNPRFLSIYTGTDVKGDPGQPVNFDMQGKPLPPDPSKPYYGVGFKLDTPNRAGNCATCHTPVASQVPNNQNCSWSGCHTSLTIERSNGVIPPATSAVVSSGAGLDGISCEFCHKVGDIILDPKTKLPKPDMPGILSMRLYRPEGDAQLFFGTMLDVTRRVSYLPLQSQSEYCAACHYGVFGGVVGMGTVTGGTVIYNSYGEWLNSPYSDPKTGKTCQDCHMPVLDTQVSVFPEKGGIPRDYTPFHSHYMPGAADEKLLQNSVSLVSSAQRVGGQLQVQVSVTNDQTGHDIPTDSPNRSMILVIEVVDAQGKTVNLLQGPVNPAWSGNYSGTPGKTFAKVLRDDWTGETPTAAYWRPVTVVEDSRLAPLATDSTQYTFDLPAGVNAQVNVKLFFRRTFQEIAQQKGFTDPDILMETVNIPVEK